LDRIWIDLGSIFRESPNSARYTPLANHAYSVTNVLDDGTIPKTSEWWLFRVFSGTKPELAAMARFRASSAA
jgi:hypothetical protein